MSASDQGTSNAHVTDRKSGPAMMHRTLAGLPELEHFESEDQKKLALAQIESEAGNPMSRGWWLGITILIGSVIAVVVALRVLIPRLPLLRDVHDEVQDLIRIAAAVATFALVLRWLHRRGGRAALREKLLAAGVPVCRKCGYSLRGLSLEAARCPECGREFDADVRAILAMRPAVPPNPLPEGERGG